MEVLDVETKPTANADVEDAGSPEPIEWPPSPVHESSVVDVAAGQ